MSPFQTLSGQSLSVAALAVALLVACSGADGFTQQPPQPSTSPATRAPRPGSLRGRVSDEFGAVIVGAAVTLKDAAGGAQGAQTNREGVYAFDKLPPASYVIIVAAAGGLHDQAPEERNVRNISLLRSDAGKRTTRTTNISPLTGLSRQPLS